MSKIYSLSADGEHLATVIEKTSLGQTLSSFETALSESLNSSIKIKSVVRFNLTDNHHEGSVIEVSVNDHINHTEIDIVETKIY